MMDSSNNAEPTFVSRVSVSFGRKWQHLMDKSTVYVNGRWIGFAVVFTLYLVRVMYIQAFHIITYGLGIYLLNNFIGFLSPAVDPETEGPVLPSSSSEEFRPFSRRVPEFKFWYTSTRATVIALFMTLFSVFNVSVFWPILLMYFILLFGMTMKRQIKHMWKHNYVPWTSGKQVYKGGNRKSSK